MKFIGIDYGSKKAGTTVISHRVSGKVEFLQSEKNQDADLFLLKKIQLIKPQSVFIDAPLSVPPGVINGSGDCFYRICDRELNAMSPMFLGGLTARAIQLKHNLEKRGMKVYEVYPKATAIALNLQHYQKREKVSKALLDELLQTGFEFLTAPQNYHQVDAFLCFVSGQRYINTEAQFYGTEKEGRIIV